MSSKHNAHRLIAVVAILEVSLSFFSAYFLSDVIKGLSTPEKNIWLSCGIYFLAVCAAVLINIGTGFLLNHFRNLWLKSSWELSISKPVLYDSRFSGGDFYTREVEQRNRYFELSLSHTYAWSQAIGVYLVLMAVICFEGAFKILPVFCVSTILQFASYGCFKNKHLASLRDFNFEKQTFSAFQGSYFRNFWARLGSVAKFKDHGYRERFVADHGKGFFDKQKKIFRLALARGVVKFLLCDLPLYGGVVVLVYLTSRGYFSVAMFFFWMSASQLLIRGNSSLRMALDQKSERSSLSSVLKATHCDSTAVRSDDLAMRFSASFDPAPGLTLIRAANGSGKSTWMRALLGEPEALSFYPEHGAVSQNHTVYWSNGEFERCGDIDSFVLDEGIFCKTYEGCFDSALCMEILDHYQKMSQMLTSNAKGQMSDGQRSWMSLMRILSESPQSGSVYLWDELDAALDAPKRECFARICQGLSKRFAVYVISHDLHSAHVKPAVIENSCDGHVFAVDLQKNHGHAISFRLSVERDCAKKRIAKGNIALALLTELDTVLGVLSKQDSYFFELQSHSLEIDCELLGVQVGQTKSAGLSLAVALCNLKRLHEGKPIARNIVGSAEVNSNGELLEVAGLDLKIEAARRLLPMAKFLSCQNIKTIYNVQECLN